MQPEVAAPALDDELLTKLGFMSRILVCPPESLIGKRMHKEPPPEATADLCSLHENACWPSWRHLIRCTRYAKRA